LLLFLQKKKILPEQQQKRRLAVKLEREKQTLAVLPELAVKSLIMCAIEGV